MRKFIPVLLLILFSSPAYSWEAKNNDQANIDAHHAAFCITIPSHEIGSFSWANECADLKTRWFRSGLTVNDAWYLNSEESPNRRVYRTASGNWQIEFCKQSLFKSATCGIIP